MAIVQDAIYTDPASFSQIAAGIVGLPVGQSVNNLNLLLTPSVSANSQIINAAPTATTITAVNTKSLTGTAVNVVLPAITPAANGGGITLTGLALSQGAIANVADSEAITVKQLIITGAAGAALETGVYTWSGIDITTPAQAANAAVNLGYGIKITGGATAGAATAAQYGVHLTMAAVTDTALYVAVGKVVTEESLTVKTVSSVTANSQSLNAVPTANTLTAANTKTFVAIGQNISIPAIVPVANGGGITMTGLRLSQGAISNVADSEAITIRQIWISGAAGAALATGVYTWAGVDIAMPAQAANGANNLAFGVRITGGAKAGGASAAQTGIQIAMASATDYALECYTGLGYFGSGITVVGASTSDRLNLLLTPSVSASSQTLGAAPTATTLTAVNAKSFAGTAQNIVLPAIVPVANGSGITLTGLALSQGAITNAADSEAITVKQIVVTGAAGVALETGVYTWSGIDITTPAQAANGAVNLGRGIKITGGATAGGAGAYQRGIDITMAAATDNAIYVGTGQSYFGGNIFLVDGATIGQATGPLLTFNDTSNYLLISGCSVGIGTLTPTVALEIHHSTTPTVVVRNLATAALENVARLFFQNTLTSGAIHYTGFIDGVQLHTTQNSGGLVFSVYNNGTVVAAMRIINTGYVGIGTATPSHVLTVAGNIGGGGAATLNIYGNNAVTDATGRDIILSVLDVTNDAWRTMIQVQPIAGAASAACKLGLYGVTPVVQPTGVAAQKVNYGAGELDTEAEVIAAFNTTNAAINTIRTALNALGVTTTV